MAVSPSRDSTQRCSGCGRPHMHFGCDSIEPENPLLLVPGIGGSMVHVREKGSEGEGERVWVTVSNAESNYQRLWGAFDAASSTLELLVPGTEVVVARGSDESGLYPLSVLDPDAAFAVRGVHYMDALIDFLKVGTWIAVGCPFGGTPGWVVDALVTGVQFAGSLGQFFFVSQATSRQACLQSPAMYELLPPLDFPYKKAPPQLRIWLAGPMPSELDPGSVGSGCAPSSAPGSDGGGGEREQVGSRRGRPQQHPAPAARGLGLSMLDTLRRRLPWQVQQQQGQQQGQRQGYRVAVEARAGQYVRFWPAPAAPTPGPAQEATPPTSSRAFGKSGGGTGGSSNWQSKRSSSPPTNLPCATNLPAATIPTTIPTSAGFCASASAVGSGGSSSDSRSGPRSGSREYIFSHSDLPGLLEQLLAGNTVSLEGDDYPLPFSIECWDHAQDTHKLWGKAEDLPKECRFYNLYGVGLNTPYSLQYGSWWWPVKEVLPYERYCTPILQDLEQLPQANATFTYVDGDMTVTSESAQADGLRATERVGIKAAHRDLVSSPNAWEHIVRWLRVKEGGCSEDDRWVLVPPVLPCCCACCAEAT